MLMIGYNLLSAADKLQVTNEANVHEMLRNPNSEMVNKITQLRTVMQIDKKQYATLKRSLPYLVCGSFNQPFRRLENFAYTDCFIIDVDHLSEKGINLTQVRHLLEQDPRVTLCFKSPGEDGLKVLIHLKERCYEAEIFKLFYKIFINKFSMEYNLEQAVDSRTCDVTRACFLSVDEEAYFNNSAEPVDINDYIDRDNLQGLMELKRHIEKAESALPAQEEQPSVEPDAVALAKIRQTLNQRKKAVVEPKSIYVPEELEQIIGDVITAIESNGIVVADVCDIQYGKKLKVKLGSYLGEINLFYGKNGFTVVKSPKRGTSENLNQVTADLIDAFLEDSEANDMAFLNVKKTGEGTTNGEVFYLCE
jgi:hypothetical protein